jgi:ABC-type phosphate transport system substrate-binding protein
MKRTVILLAAVVFFVLAGAAGAMAQDVAVVVHRSNPADTISMTELRKILLTQQTQWPTGKKITVLMTQSERPGALKTVAGMNENDFNVHLMHATFNGDSADPPKVVGSGAQVKQAVAAQVGAIGFMGAGDVDASVKILKVNGLVPGQPGYPLSPK